MKQYTMTVLCVSFWCISACTTGKTIQDQTGLLADAPVSEADTSLQAIVRDGRATSLVAGKWTKTEVTTRDRILSRWGRLSYYKLFKFSVAHADSYRIEVNSYEWHDKKDDLFIPVPNFAPFGDGPPLAGTIDFSDWAEGAILRPYVVLVDSAGGILRGDQPNLELLDPPFFSWLFLGDDRIRYEGIWKGRVSAPGECYVIVMADTKGPSVVGTTRRATSLLQAPTGEVRIRLTVLN